LTRASGATHNHVIVTLAPPRCPSSDELEALIREARARQRRRRLRAAVLVASLAGVALGLHSIIAGSGSTEPTVAAGPTAGVRNGSACGVRVAWTKILDRNGHVLYREPVRRTMGHQLRCSGSSVWVVFYNGVASSQEGYFGVHSRDGGRTWRPVFTERYFGMKAPHALDAYMGVWTLRGSHAAYFTGRCPACGWGTVSLWVTKDGGRTFRRYKVPALTGYAATAIRVFGNRVTIAAERWTAVPGSKRKTVTMHVA
jgi:hypothetical protein